MPERRMRIRRWNARAHGLGAAGRSSPAIAMEDKATTEAVLKDRRAITGRITAAILITVPR